MEELDKYFSEQYDTKIQYASIEAGIEAHAEDYSFNIESELFQQLTREQQVLWQKEIEQAAISGGHCGVELARDKRYEENREPVSEDLEKAAIDICSKVLKGETIIIDGYECVVLSDAEECFKAGAQWQSQQDSIFSKDLEELIDTLSKRYPEVSFAKLSRIAVRVANWQKSNLWKPANGDDLPEIDREVIALLDNGKVVFAHRPPEYWDGKDIVTGKVTRNYPKTYDKGGWNMPNIKWWLDLELPCGGRTISMNYTDKNKEQTK